jgi:hypothetical protein
MMQIRRCSYCLVFLRRVILFKFLVFFNIYYYIFSPYLRVEVGVAASTAINAAVHRKSGSEVMVQV